MHCATPTMFEIVAVGAIARQFELRMPTARTRSRSASQSSVRPRSTSSRRRARRVEQLERVDRQDAAAPRASLRKSDSGRAPPRVGGSLDRVEGDRLHDRSANSTAASDAYGIRSAYSASWKPITPRPTGRWRRFDAARLRHAVVVDVDHVVEHPHRRAHGALERARDRAPASRHVLGEIHRAQVADRDLVVRRVQRDLGAEVRAVDDARVLLRRAQVARVLERDPRMARLEQHREHLAPELHRRTRLKS